jgi:hypothetical protein
LRFLAEDFPKYINEFCQNVDKRLGKRGDKISALGKDIRGRANEKR